MISRLLTLNKYSVNCSTEIPVTVYTCQVKCMENFPLCDSGCKFYFHLLLWEILILIYCFDIQSNGLDLLFMKHY